MKNNGENREVRVLVNAPLGMGGITSLMLTIQNGMDRSQINLDYLVLHEGVQPREDIAISLGGRKIVVSADKFKFGIIRGIIRFFKFVYTCRKEGFKILHYNGGVPMDLLYIVAAKFGGVKYATFHSHNSGISNINSYTKIISGICKLLMRLFVDDFWACSSEAAKFSFPKSIYKNKKYYFMPNAIDIERFSYDEECRKNIRKEMGWNNKFVVGHAGRFTAQKNHMFLLEIFKRIHELEPNSILVLFGDGELFDKVKNRVKELELTESVTFYGGSRRMNEMYQGMDVFLLPSLFEGLPVTGVEAQAAGLPTVFSDLITKEVNLSDEVEYVSLNASLYEWANKVLKFKNIKRHNNDDILLKAGFDQREMIKHFQNYYLNAAKNLNIK